MDFFGESSRQPVRLAALTTVSCLSAGLLVPTFQDGGRTWVQLWEAAPWGPRCEHGMVALEDDTIIVMEGINSNTLSDVCAHVKYVCLSAVTDTQLLAGLEE